MVTSSDDCPMFGIKSDDPALSEVNGQLFRKQPNTFNTEHFYAQVSTPRMTYLFTYKNLSIIDSLI